MIKATLILTDGCTWDPAFESVMTFKNKDDLEAHVLYLRKNFWDVKIRKIEEVANDDQI